MQGMPPMGGPGFDDPSVPEGGEDDDDDDSDDAGPPPLE